MSDHLVSPAIGACFWIASGTSFAKSSAKLAGERNPPGTSFVASLAAFVFAAQMLNFTIPGTGSSGHFCGGIMLAALLGPHAAFVVMSVILSLQCLIFADGGILALGCNVFNMAFVPCFAAYPFVFRPIASSFSSRVGGVMAALASSVAALQIGALCVVLQTCLSGISGLPLREFLSLMLPVHLAIGLVEGMATAGLVAMLSVKGDVSERPALPHPSSSKTVFATLAAGGLAIGGILSSFASENPDGLEWSLERSGAASIGLASSEIHVALGAIHERMALFPDYGLAFWKAGPGVPGILGWVATFAAVAFFMLCLRSARGIAPSRMARARP